MTCFASIFTYLLLHYNQSSSFWPLKISLCNYYVIFVAILLLAPPLLKKTFLINQSFVFINNGYIKVALLSFWPKTAWYHSRFDMCFTDYRSTRNLKPFKYRQSFFLFFFFFTQQVPKNDFQYLPKTSCGN